jgi:hypothetical protein
MLSPKKQRGAEDPHSGQHHGDAATLGPAPPAPQSDQRHDAALAVVVYAHHQHDVGQGDDDHH